MDDDDEDDLMPEKEFKRIAFATMKDVRMMDARVRDGLTTQQESILRQATVLCKGALQAYRSHQTLIITVTAQRPLAERENAGNNSLPPPFYHTCLQHWRPRIGNQVHVTQNGVVRLFTSA